MLPKLAYRLEPKAEKDDVTHLVTSHCFVTSMTQGPTTQIERVLSIIKITYNTGRPFLAYSN